MQALRWRSPEEDREEGGAAPNFHIDTPAEGTHFADGTGEIECSGGANLPGEPERYDLKLRLHLDNSYIASTSGWTDSAGDWDNSLTITGGLEPEMYDIEIWDDAGVKNDKCVVYVDED